MATQEYLVIPDTQEKIYEGSVVVLFRLPNLKWILHNGYYNYNGKRRRGWYFSSIPADTQMPVFQEDLVRLRVLEGGSQPFPPVPPGPFPPGPFPPGPFPPVPPVPPAPIPNPFTPADKKALDAAMLTFQDLEERDKFSGDWLVNGKVVRVNDIDGQGTPEYYSWNSSTSSWDLASLGYRYMTRDEITQAIGGDIVDIVWSDDNGSLVVTNKEGVSGSVLLEGVANNPKWNAELLEVTIPVYGKPDFKFRIPRDKSLISLRYEPNWHFTESNIAPAIVATVSNGTTSEEIACDATPMVNLFDGQETATTQVIISDSNGGSVKCNVKLSSVANNPLKVDNEGMWVDLSGVVAKKQINTGFLLVADGNGEFTYAGNGIEIETTTAISDLTNPEKKVVTANLIIDAISAAITALRILLSDRIAAVETRVSDLENKLNFGEGQDGDILVTNDDKVARSGYQIGTDILTDDANKLATDKAVYDALTWKSIE